MKMIRNCFWVMAWLLAVDLILVPWTNYGPEHLFYWVFGIVALVSMMVMELSVDFHANNFPVHRTVQLDSRLTMEVTGNSERHIAENVPIHVFKLLLMTSVVGGMVLLKIESLVLNLPIAQPVMVLMVDALAVFIWGKYVLSIIKRTWQTRSSIVFA